MSRSEEPSSEGTLRTGQLVHSAVFASSIGRTHRVNQDAGGAWTFLRPDGTHASLLVVADGVSAGHRSEEASRLTSDLLRQEMASLLGDGSISVDDLADALPEVVREANHAVSSRPHASASTADATTLVAAFCVGTHGGGSWVGDSRMYRLSGDGMEQVTRDHSWAEGVVSLGYMTPEEAAADPRANMITRWLGPPDRADPGVENFRFELAAGDTVLCCSDGLYRYFTPPISAEEEIGEIIRSFGDDLEGAVSRLVDSALERGGHDDITIAALRVTVRP